VQIIYRIYIIYSFKNTVKENNNIFT